MDYLFLFLLVLSLAGLVAGLMKPSLVRQPTRVRASLIFGVATVVFFILIGVTVPSTPQQSTVMITAAPERVASSTVTSDSKASVAASSTATSAQTDSPSCTPFCDMQQNDTLYISFFNSRVAPEFQFVGSDLQSAGSAMQNYDFSDAISDMQNVQSDLQDAQTELNDAVYGPMTPDMVRINTLLNDAFANGLKGASVAITDLENADNAGVNSVAIPDFNVMDNDYLQAKELMAGWQAKNQE